MYTAQQVRQIVREVMSNENRHFTVENTGNHDPSSDELFENWLRHNRPLMTVYMIDIIPGDEDAYGDVTEVPQAA
jgi:hypothetical protein